jgi:hypothetical protein
VVNKVREFKGTMGGFTVENLMKGGPFNPLVDISEYPTILQLQASDGDNQHVVGIVDEWVFDSNNHFAVELTKENLDRCCLGEVVFKQAATAWRFVPTKEMKRKMSRAKKAEMN